jgi:tripeptidyl-peptidase-1
LRLYSHVPLLRFRYGAHLSKEQVAQLVKPSTNTLELVNAWLRHHGIRSSSISMTHCGGWLTVTNVLVSQASQILGASYQLYRNAKTNDTIIRTVGYALPAVLRTHIQTVAPTTYFDSTRVMWQTPRKRSFGAAQAQAASGKVVTGRASRIGSGNTPSILRWMHSTVTYAPAATDSNKLGVVGMSNDYPRQADLSIFATDYATDATGATFTVELVNGGGNDPDDPAWMANGAIQYTGMMTYPTPLIFYSTGAHIHPILGLLEYLVNQQTLPQTISMPYSVDEHMISREFAEAMCDMFAHLGLRGVSILVSSGFDGVGAGTCIDDDEILRFIPEFPSSCTCGILPSTTQARVQVAHQTAMVSQVPLSPPSAVLQVSTPRSRRSYPEAASRPTLSALSTSAMRCKDSSITSANSIMASTSALAAVT